MNCKQATLLLSEKMDRPLSPKEKVALGIHTTMCSSCRRFSGQMDKLRFISKHYAKGNDSEKK